MKGMPALLVQTLVMTFVLGFPAWLSAEEFNPGKVGFTLSVDGYDTSYHTLFATVMPGRNLELRVAEGGQRENFLLTTPAGTLTEHGRRGWRWRAPTTPGHYPLTVSHRSTGETMLLQVFVLVPATEVRNGLLNGYRIGEYPSRPFRGLPAYRAPRGFIEVTEATTDLAVSPHFRLGQFLSKQPSDYPKYLVLRPRLLIKLELLLEDVNLAGVRTDGFVIMSGYRTPFYNRMIGNSPNSRHVYGGAADIYIDEGYPPGMMDDLNQDGVSDLADLDLLHDLANTLAKRHGRPDLVGGLGKYDARLPVRGPFIHVDVRGTPARWRWPSG